MRFHAFFSTLLVDFPSLMIFLSVVVGNNLPDGVPQRVFAKEDHLLQTILFDCPDKPFRVRV